MRLTQGALAARLEISQAHYSKVIGGIVPLSEALSQRMTHWLSSSAIASGRPSNYSEIDELARSIKADARRLSQLVKATNA